MRTGITGAFGVTGESDNGRRVVELYAERRVCVGNKYFNHKGMHKHKGGKGRRKSGGK